MNSNVAIIGAGVSGLTTGTVFAEAGYRTTIFAADIGDRTTSAVAAAIWYPYDAEPAAAVIRWSLATFETLRELSRDPATGVVMLQLRQFSRVGSPEIPDWAISLGAAPIPAAETPATFSSGFALTVPLTDTTLYLEYLARRFAAAGGVTRAGTRFAQIDDVPAEFDLVVNCAGVGARELADDPAVEPHRGQVILVPKLQLDYAVVCDDPPLMYAIPRSRDCVFGGTNEISENLAADTNQTRSIVAECSAVVGIANPESQTPRVGLRPYRRGGIRLECARAKDGRAVIHNYGHGGSGFTLSWGCAREVLDLARSASP